MIQREARNSKAASVSRRDAVSLASKAAKFYPFQRLQPLY